MSSDDGSNFSHPIDPLEPLYFRVRPSAALDLAKRGRSGGMFLETLSHLQVTYRTSLPFRYAASPTLSLEFASVSGNLEERKYHAN